MKRTLFLFALPVALLAQEAPDSTTIDLIDPRLNQIQNHFTEEQQWEDEFLRHGLSLITPGSDAGALIESLESRCRQPSPPVVFATSRSRRASPPFRGARPAPTSKSRWI